MEKKQVNTNGGMFNIDSSVIRCLIVGSGGLFNSEIQMWKLYPIFTIV